MRALPKSRLQLDVCTLAGTPTVDCAPTSLAASPATPAQPIPTSLFGSWQQTPLLPPPPRYHPIPQTTHTARRQILSPAELLYSSPPPPDHDFEPDHNADPDTDLDAAQPGLFDSDDDMATHDLPKIVRGHQPYGDAEFFCIKACRLLRSG